MKLIRNLFLLALALGAIGGGAIYYLSQALITSQDPEWLKTSKQKAAAFYKACSQKVEACKKAQ